MSDSATQMNFFGADDSIFDVPEDQEVPVRNRDSAARSDFSEPYAAGRDSAEMRAVSDGGKGGEWEEDGGDSQEFDSQDGDCFIPDPNELTEAEEIVAAMTETAKSGVVELRDYQHEAVNAVLNDFRQKINAPLTVMATGSGKSICLAKLAHVANGRGHNVLILVHREELIRQLGKSCARLAVPVLIEKASERALIPFAALRHDAEQSARSGGSVQGITVIGCVASLRGKRLETWPRDSFKLIIVDEAHHCLKSNTYGAVLRHFGAEDGRCRVAGYTATPDRLDDRNLGQVFDCLSYEFNLRDAVIGGWLVPVRAVVMATEPKINLKDLRIVAGDFHQGDLDKTIQDNIGVLVNAIAQSKVIEGRRTIAFTPNVASAEALSLALSDVGISARFVAGTTPPELRKEILEDHQAGRFQVLCNCMIGVEGYDDPEISAVIICRPTKSRGLYSQMAGRATRRFPMHLSPSHPDAIKKDCLLVDFAYITGKHELVSAVDLYDKGNTPDAVVKRAREMIESGEERSLDRALESAQGEFDLSERERIQKRLVQVTASKFDPLFACEMFGVVSGKAGSDWQDARPASERMKEVLSWNRVDGTGLGFGTAHNLIGKIMARKEHGWTSIPTIQKLVRAGFDLESAKGMREAEAQKYLAVNPPVASEKQVKFLVWKGVPRAQAAAMTMKEASAKISEIKQSEGMRSEGAR